MELQNEKCVMVMEETLPLGVLANTAGILGITLGKQVPEAVGPDVMDQSGKMHRGIVQIPVPILKASQERIRAIRTQLYQKEFSDLVVVDFSDVAQSCHVYTEFMEKSSRTEESDYRYYGLAICGAKKLINKLTGSLPLLR